MNRPTSRVGVPGSWRKLCRFSAGNDDVLDAVHLLGGAAVRPSLWIHISFARLLDGVAMVVTGMAQWRSVGLDTSDDVSRQQKSRRSEERRVGKECLL